MAKTIQRLTDTWKICLENSRVEENRLYLPWQLDRKDYVELNKVLELMGWKWDKWQKCHIFDCENLSEAIGEICETMEIMDVKVLYQQYYTPSELAKRLVELACIRSMDDVLEPSAWRGAIVAEIEKIPHRDTYICEIDKNNIDELMKFKRDWVYINECDFLTKETRFLVDKIVANPPFSKSQDVKHILEMYEHLKEWWRIVSIASASTRTREWKLYDNFHALNPEFIEIENWTFKDSGTMVNSVIVIVNK